MQFRWRNSFSLGGLGTDHITADDRGVVLEAIPENRFVFQWHPDSPAYATTVELQSNQLKMVQ